MRDFYIGNLKSIKYKKYFQSIFVFLLGFVLFSMEVFAQCSTPILIDSVNVTQPTCTQDGVIVVNATGGGETLEYSFDNGLSYQTANTFSGPSGSYDLIVRYVTDTTCAVSYASNPVLLNSISPPILIDSVNLTQPTCTQDGVIVVNATGGGETLEYSFDNGLSYQTANTFSGPSGSYDVIVRYVTDTTCAVSYASNPVLLNSISPPILIDSVNLTQPTCTQDGVIVVNATGGGETLEYSFDNGLSYQTANTFSGPSGSYDVIVRYVTDTTCTVSYASNPVLLNSISPPIVSTSLTQPTCSSPGQIVVNATASGSQTLMYSINGGSTFQASNIFNNLSSGTYNIVVRYASPTDCLTSITETLIEPSGCSYLRTAISSCNQGYTKDGQYKIVYKVTVENTSYFENVYDIQMVNDLRSIFGNIPLPNPHAIVEIENISMSTTNRTDIYGHAFTFPLEYNGSSINTTEFDNLDPTPGADGILLSSAVTDNTLYPRQYITFNYCIYINPAIAGGLNVGSGNGVTFNNIFRVSNSINGGTPQSNVSISDFHTTETTVAAELFVPNNTPLVNFDGTYDFTNKVVVTNDGSSTAYNVQYYLPMNAFVNDGIPLNTYVVTQISGPATAVANASYNGTTVNGIMATGSSLAPGETAVYKITYNVGPTTYSNWNYWGTPNPSMTQGSPDGYIENPNYDSYVEWSDAEGNHMDRFYQGASSDNVASSLLQCSCPGYGMRFPYTVGINLVKSITSNYPAASGVSGNRDIVFRLVVSNNATSNVQVDNLVLNDDLTSICSASNIISVQIPQIVGSTALVDPNINIAYNGLSDIAVFDGTSGILEPGQQVIVEFKVEMADTCVGQNKANYSAQDPNNLILAFITSSVPVSILTPIFANDDTGTDLFSAIGGTTVLNVLHSNGNNIDTLDSAPTTTSNIILSQVDLWPAGISLNISTGEVNVAPGTPAGTYNLTYQICQTTNPTNCDTAIITFNVIDDTPVAEDDYIPINEDSSISGTVVNNDTLSGDGGNVWSLVGANGGALHGTVTMYSDGTYNYTPNPNFNGSDTFDYQICDANGDCESATVTITVNPVNDVPVANNDNANINEDMPLNATVTGNDTPSGDGGNVWSLQGTDGGALNGTVTMNQDGTYTYTPDLNFNGTDLFTYTVCDLNNDCSTATVTVNVNSVNDPPVANPDSATTTYDTDVTFSADGNDTDIDGYVMGATVDLNPSTLAIDNTFTDASGNIWTVDADGNITFNPSPTFVGTAIIPYTVRDNGGATSNPANLSVTVSNPTCVDAINEGMDVCAFLNANQSNPFGTLDCDGDGVNNLTECTNSTDPVDPCSPTQVAGYTGYNAANVVWQAADCDGDGVPNTNEINGPGTPTDPYDPCAFNEFEQTLANVSQAWFDADCDGDGVTNGQEMIDGTDPQNPCSFVLANATVDPSTAWDDADCDGDGVTNGDEVADGTDPLDFCDFETDSQSVDPSTAWNDADCDNDNLTNGDEITEGTDPHNPDTDGDGVLDGTEVTDGTDPLDACDFELLHQTITPTAAWQAADCDGDGVTNQQEVIDGTNPQDLCEFILANATVDPSTAWNDADCDGDGVTNGDEVADGTDPLDFCDFITDSQSVDPSTEWNDADCDNDNLTNGDEITEGTDPHNPDTDGDGVLDGTEVTDGTDPLDSCDFELLHQTVTPTAAWQGGDCDGDGVTNQQEVEDGTDPQNPCSFVLVNATVDPSTAWDDADCDGDGVTNGDEVADGTDPLDFCDFETVSQSVDPSTAWNDADCDNDNLTNGDEITEGTDPHNPDTDGDGVLDGTEVTDGTDPLDACDFELLHQTITPTAAWQAADCDGDGVTNQQEVEDGTNPLDGCDFILANQDTTPSAAWLADDCDSDGLTNGVEVSTTHTNPLDDDTDNDGIMDGNEVTLGTNPLDTDSDNDGILDGTEIGLTAPQGNDTDLGVFVPDADPISTTNPLDADTDNDGIIDGNEDADHDGKVDPNETDPYDVDTDNDGIQDGTEIGLTTPQTPDTNTTVFVADTDPTTTTNPLDDDSDDDGFIDGNEDVDHDGLVDVGETDPNNPDTDNDGIQDGTEASLTTPQGTDTDPSIFIPDADPSTTTDNLDPDTDGDGVLDGTEDDNHDGAVNGPNETDPNDICDFIVSEITVTPDAAWSNGDCDGDGVTNYEEVFVDHTDPHNFCEFNYPQNTTPSTAWLAADCDNDTVTNGDELPLDTDGDGFYNVFDNDDDNDLIPTAVEAETPATPVNSDNNGLPNYLDIDSDNDGISDTVEAGDNPAEPQDTDGDGIEDYKDIDSDNDGMTDTFEAGGDDVNADGQIDGFEDTNNNGMDDATEATPLPTPDTDNDGKADYLDIDADNDSIPDNVEAQTTDGYEAPTGTDTDGDGLDNAYDPDNGDTSLNTPLDFDADGTPDIRDADSDADGVDDVMEANDANFDGILDVTVSTADLDGDGLLDVFEGNNPNDGFDVNDEIGNPALPSDLQNYDGTDEPDYRDIDDDNDGVNTYWELNPAGGDPLYSDTDVHPNYLDIDDDGDGVNTMYENPNEDGDGNPNTGNTQDFDNDGIDDYLDIDDDGDGVNTMYENPNPDGDGNPNTGTTLNSDGDAFNNYLDVDDDGDGVNTEYENPNPDGDGIPNTGLTQDFDDDATYDYLDIDDDNDGVNTVNESPNPDGDGNPNTGDTLNSDGDVYDNYLDIDDDGDGVNTMYENPNPDGDGNPNTGNTQDFDTDGTDDYLDIDDDGDGVNTFWENPNSDGDGNPNTGNTQDSDTDGNDDYLDIDDDGDGVTTINENPNPDGDGNPNTGNTQDLDEDGEDDYLDIDDDGDGIPTADEDINGDGNPMNDDTDGDGVPNYMDIDDDNDGILTLNESTEDTDDDGNVDYLDQDSDADGISDNVEGQPTVGYVAPLVDDPATTTINEADVDGDGLNDAYDDNIGYDGSNGIDPYNADGQDTPDYVDTDSDNDGVQDATEAFDFNHDGRPDTTPSGLDNDHDGLDDAFDADNTSYDDPFGGYYNEENVFVNFNNGANSTNNTDGNDEPDFRDIDDDNDNIPTGDLTGEDSITEDCDNDDIPNYLDPESCDLIPTAFSPGNGDGVNDTWEIPYLVQFPDFRLEIYDRWGNLVYEYTRKDALQDDIKWWDGTSNGRFNYQDGEILPYGTYFYIMNPNHPDHKPQTGWVYLNR